MEETQFSRFVHDYGVSELARRLAVHPTAVHHWVTGSNSPHPANAIRISILAREFGTPLTLDEIYQHFREVRSERFLPACLKI